MKKGQTDDYILNTPKPLLEVDGEPIISHSIRKLIDAGAEVSVVINRHDETAFRDKLKGFDVWYCYQDEPLGTGHALFSSRDFVKDDLFMVMMGDDLVEQPAQDILSVNAPTVFVQRVTDVGSYGAVVDDGRGKAKEIREKSTHGEGVANTGVMVLPKSFFNIYGRIIPNPENGEIYLTDAVGILYEYGQALQIRELETWKGINTPEQLADANRDLSGRVTVRKARMDDLPGIISLLHQLSPEEESGSNQIDYKLEDTMSYIMGNEDYFLAVAEVGKKAVSTATLLIQRNLTHEGRPYGHIENVVTDTRYRGKSIGKKVVDRLVGYAIERGCYKVILDCSIENVNFYRKCGFEKNGEIEMRLNVQDRVKNK